MIERDHPKLRVREQVEILKLTRSSLYYRARPPDPVEEILKREIRTQYLMTPFYGARRMAVHLRTLGHMVGRKLAASLMNALGIKAIYPKPNLSKRRQDHKVYPYLLRDLKIARPNHVWATDITYIPTPGGHVYLVAVLDWASRKVLSWRLSNTLSTHFCLEALDEALARYGKPEIFNTDQGCQFTSEEFTNRLKASGISISMDGKGRCLDNIIVERFWRSIKYEMIFLHEYTTMTELRARIAHYVQFYNDKRPHQSHDYETPTAVYAKAA
jgi:putative transposase